MTGSDAARAEATDAAARAPANIGQIAALLRSASEISWSGQPIETCMQAAVDLICAFTGWPLGHVYLYDRARDELVPADVWHDDDSARFRTFVERSGELRFRPGEGIPGKILSTAQKSLTVSVSDDPLCLRADLAAEGGITSCFAMPAISTDGVEGVMEFFSTDTIVPDADLLDIFGHVGAQLGAAIQLKRAQDSLVESEIRLAEAQHLARLGSYRYEAAGDVLTFSPELDALYGFDEGTTPRSFEGYLRVVHPDDVDLVKRSIVEALEGRTTFEHEYRLITPFGEERWAHSRGLATDDGEQVVLTGYCQDITERRRLEDAFLAAKDKELDVAAREREVLRKLHEIERTKNAILVGVSHELRTPLTVIVGIAHTLRRSAELDPRDRDDLLDRMEANVERLHRMLRDLLDLDRLSRGIVRPVGRPTPMYRLIAQVVETHLGERHFTLDVDHFFADVDAGLVERIVENLVMNAVLHTGSEAQVWVCARRTEEGTLIAVDDAGPGVPEDARRSIFEAFQHGPSAREEGAGIGLALVARFAELHGGRAWVQEREGGGASFRVLLPDLPRDD